MNYGSGPQLRFGGAYVVAGQFGAWDFRLARSWREACLRYAWKNGGADQYLAWNVDSSGQFSLAGRHRVWQLPGTRRRSNPSCIGI